VVFVRVLCLSTRSSQQSCANIDLVPISKAWLSANRTLNALNMTPTTKNEAFTIPNPTVCATTQNAILENQGPAHWTTRNTGACILDQRRSSFIYLASDRGNATPPTMPLTLKHDLKHNPSEEEPFAILNLVICTTTQTRPVLKNQGPVHPLGLTSSPSLRTATIGRSAVFDPASPSSQV
jgi:hypothetical protein